MGRPEEFDTVRKETAPDAITASRLPFATVEAGSDEANQASDGISQTRTGLPLQPPLTALVGIAILILLPGALDHLVPGFPAINEMQPHIFWLPVLLLTLQYGSVSGLLAAGAAVAVSSLLEWPGQGIGESHLGYLLRISLQPVLWIATAVILGHLRLRQIEREQALDRSVVRLTRQRATLAAHVRGLRERCDRLERFIATRHEPDAGISATPLAPEAPATETADARGDTARLPIRRRLPHLATASSQCGGAIWLLDDEQLCEHVEIGRTIDLAAPPPKSFPAIMATGSLAERQAVLGLIARHFDPAFLPTLRIALASPEPLIRTQAAAIASRLGSRMRRQLHDQIATADHALADPVDALRLQRTATRVQARRPTARIRRLPRSAATTSRSRRGP